VCWCVGVLVCWCVGVLVCWCVGVLVCWCVGVLVCWCVGEVFVESPLALTYSTMAYSLSVVRSERDIPLQALAGSLSTWLIVQRDNKPSRDTSLHLKKMS